MGVGSDRYGRKPFLILSLIGSCFGTPIHRTYPTPSVIADVVPANDRNTYMSRLDAVGSTAYILGPALGGILCQVNNHLPLYPINPDSEH